MILNGTMESRFFPGTNGGRLTSVACRSGCRRPEVQGSMGYSRVMPRCRQCVSRTEHFLGIEPVCKLELTVHESQN